MNSSVPAPIPACGAAQVSNPSPSGSPGTERHSQDSPAALPAHDEAEGVLADLQPVERGRGSAAHPRRAQRHLIALPGRVPELRAESGQRETGAPRGRRAGRAAP